MNAFRPGKAALSALIMVLAGCGGGGGGGSTSPPPSGNPNPQPTNSHLTLTGTVTDAPIANAVVTATIGGQTFTANADANGNYSLEITIPESSASGFVTLSAKGVGAQSYVEFTSLVGTFSALLTQAGSDATLSNTENFATQITNVSTALAVLLKEANGGDPVASEASIQTLSATLNSQDVLDLATAIKLLVDEADDYPMPGGETSLDALLSDTAARELFVDAAYMQNQTTFLNTRNEIVGDDTLVKPVTPTTVPSTLVATTLPGDVTNTYAGQDRVVAYKFNPDGTGTATASSWHTELTWTLSGASIEIAYQSPLVDILDYEPGICPEIGFGYGVNQFPVYYTVEGATLRLLSDRILAVTEDRAVTSRYCSQASTQSPIHETVTLARTIVDNDNSLPIEAADLGDSTRTLWVYDQISDLDQWSVSVMPDIADLHADGTGSTRLFNKQFTWSLGDSNREVRVTFDDGTVAKYRSLREIDDAATDVLYDLTLPNGRRNVGAGVSIYADPELAAAYTPNNAVGRHYRLGKGLDDGLPGQLGPRMRLDGNGAGSDEDELVDENGELTPWDSTVSAQRALFWHVEGEDLIVRYTRMPEPSSEFNCSLEDPSCVVRVEKRFIPLARIGARTYTLLFQRNDRNGVNELSPRQTFSTMLEYEP